MYCLMHVSAHEALEMISANPQMQLYLESFYYTNTHTQRFKTFFTPVQLVIFLNNKSDNQKTF